MSIEKATLGCGCFWCFEAAFQQLLGIEKVLPGYSGGVLSNPSYKQVCTGNTEHAEVLQIQFDSDLLSFRTAEKLISEINATQQWDQPIVTEITSFDIFYEADEYHHNYYNDHSTQPYCLAVISPKLAKLRKEYGSLLKPGQTS
jgi:peptide-methionine (S)-S-oxide reductase